jgi:DNA-binding FadR family transcriptional regulator
MADPTAASGAGISAPATEVIARVRKVRASGQIIRQLEQAILRGNLAVGDKLPSERELQGMLEVSRNTLREGLRVLEQKGLVEIRKGRKGGIFVKEISAGPMSESLELFVRSQRVTMEDISEFRQDLEGLLACRAAEKAGAAGVGQLLSLLAQAETAAAVGPGQWEVVMELDKEIHLTLARIGGNPVHCFFLQTVHNNLHYGHISALLPRDEAMVASTLAELKVIIEAVAAGDGERAERLTRLHVQRATAIMAGRK